MQTYNSYAERRANLIQMSALEVSGMPISPPLKSGCLYMRVNLPIILYPVLRKRHIGEEIWCEDACAGSGAVDGVGWCECWMPVSAYSEWQRRGMEGVEDSMGARVTNTHAAYVS